MFVLMILVTLISRSMEKEFIMEAENNRTMENHKVLHFQNATEQKAVVVKGGIPFSINFCIRQRSFVTLKNVRFLNFDHSVFINVQMNDMYDYGTYFGIGNHNKSRIFINTGIFETTRELPAGWNVLKLYSDQSIALDIFTFDVDDKKMNYPIFNCQVVCIHESHFPAEISTLVSSASMAQNSFFTKCAEVDNVDIPIYHPNVKEFSVTARLPQYKTFTNRRQANLTFCKHLTQTLWSFDNFTMTPTSDEISDQFTFLTFHESDPNSMVVVVLFKLTGESTGSINTDMGSRLFLKFAILTKNVDVLMRYKHQNGSMVNSATSTFNATHLQHMWSIPDFTWVESNYNYITLHLTTEHPLKFTIDNLRLDRRPFIPDKTVTIYKSDDVIIEAVLVEMWWRGHDRMTIRLKNGHSFEGFAFLRLYRPIPWTEGYGQVFILYQDGNARFLPVSPEGLDWIPFGTSVILGQVKQDSIRPYVAISQVDIFPEDWKLIIYFKDGGSLRMTLNVTGDYTKAYFDRIVFMNNTYLYPFVTVRSMYVEEGNTDVDSVKVDDVTTYNIMDNWGTVSGKSFAFHRRCMSKHLTLSPDIQIDILKT
jgi:hypothetical protein